MIISSTRSLRNLGKSGLVFFLLYNRNNFQFGELRDTNIIHLELNNIFLGQEHIVNNQDSLEIPSELEINGN